MKKILLFISLLIISCHNKKEVSYSVDKIKNGVIYEVNIRQYSETGHFDDFTKDIHKLKDLGVKIIWLMPIHPISKTNRKGTLGSYYSISDYKEVNSEFGTKQDLDELIKEAHKNNMLVIFDWVANHTGWDHNWIKTNKDYYTKNKNGEITDPINPETGESWGWTDVADLNFDNLEMQNEMIEAMEYWVKEHNIDGYRADAAHSCPPSFWKNAIDRLNKTKKVLMLAESDGYHPGGFELIEMFDMSYNWSGHHVLNSIAKKENNSDNLIKNINRNLNDYSKKHILMNFTSNHDENTWAGTVFDRYGAGAKTFSALTYFLPGIPLIYSGQEYGLEKRLEFFEKDFIPKNKIEYFEFYKKLNIIKKNNKTLNINSEIKFESIDLGNKNLVLFKRSDSGESIYFLANLSNETQEIKTDFEGNYKSLLIDSNYNLNKNNLQAWEFHVLK
ncbi:MAG: alpha-amylase family glycosyl hydrolase [Bacteroidetes bacterium]|jgi:alpha-amylase|nr:alpha-amylase family glycosyl hydrolase [Bacteroidota bacterium]MDA1019105.1 alpha-amylase family glycosyl hydrolase [Bacteroidota bacterium]